MATLTAHTPKAQPAWRPRTNSLEEIIAQGRTQPAGIRGALAVACATGLLMWGAFTPLDFGPLAWICLAPLCLLVRIERPTRSMYTAAWIGGLTFWIPALQWMRLGDKAMYPAWIVLAAYMAVYFPLFLALTRVAVWKLRVPVTCAVPVVWTGLELLRGFFLTGFAWYYLGHSQHRFASLTQIADLVGTYGISFVVAAFSGCLAEMVSGNLLLKWGLITAQAPHGFLETPRRRQWQRLGGCVGLFTACFLYGLVRLNGPEFPVGPKVSLIQGDFECELEHDEARWIEIQRTHERLTGEAVLQQPEFIVWPETMFRWPLLETPPGLTDAELQKAHPREPISYYRDPNIRKRLSDLAQMARAGLIVGLSGKEMDLQEVRNYNSAVLVQPDGTIERRYDKLHRVVFGEYVPLAADLPWLTSLTPYPEGFGLKAGRGVVAYESGGYRFAPIICFEDTVPHLVRAVVDLTSKTEAGPRREIDFLVNLTNDGWFRGSSEHEQHLITAKFRCIETRTPMVRAVNTGVSAIIDGDGRVRERAPITANAVVTGHVPLDPRESLYTQTGDLFGGSCLASCGLLVCVGLFARRKPALPAIPPTGPTTTI